MQFEVSHAVAGANQYKITSKDTGIRSTFFIILRRTEFHSQPVMSAVSTSSHLP